MLNVYAQGQAAGQPMPAPPSPLASFMPIILIFAIFYFLLIRPQAKKQKEHQEMLKNLSKNDEVITSGGIHGTVVNVKERTVILRVDENVKIELEKAAVTQLKKSRS
jgi:preprotein translocase subunit YajC